MDGDCSFPEIQANAAELCLKKAVFTSYGD
jgi:hypothetical protein